MAISPSSISTRLPRSVRSTVVRGNKRARVLRLIDSGIITLLACFLIFFSLSAVKTTGQPNAVFDYNPPPQATQQVGAVDPN